MKSVGDSNIRRRGQSGMVSILVTMIMMLVITLIVLGFGQIARREEREAVDQQLSTQAFLAAESGVNDAASAIHTMILAGSPVQEKNQCSPDTNGASPYSAGHMNPALTGNVSYSCLLIKTQLTDILETIPPDGTALTTPLHPVGDTIKKLHFSWTQSSVLTSSDVTTKCSAAIGAFVPGTSWQCPYSMLRVDLVPTDVGSLNRNALINNQVTFFLYPVSGAAAPLNYGSAKGAVGAMHCTPAACTADLNNLPNANTTYDIRISAIYANGGTVDITATGTTTGGPVTLRDAQAEIDSTGKAEDVLRRVQARLPLTLDNGDSGLSAPLQSGSAICKRFSAAPSLLTITDVKGQDPHNPFCNTL